MWQLLIVFFYLWNLLSDNLKVIDILLDKGSDIEAITSIRRTPFHIAVIKGYYEVAKLLVSCGCNINAVDHEKNTALHFASRVGKI